MKKNNAQITSSLIEKSTIIGSFEVFKKAFTQLQYIARAWSFWPPEKRNNSNGPTNKPYPSNKIKKYEIYLTSFDFNKNPWCPIFGYVPIPNFLTLDDDENLYQRVLSYMFAILAGRNLFGLNYWHRLPDFNPMPDLSNLDGPYRQRIDEFCAIRKLFLQLPKLLPYSSYEKRKILLKEANIIIGDNDFMDYKKIFALLAIYCSRLNIEILLRDETLRLLRDTAKQRHTNVKETSNVKNSYNNLILYFLDVAERCMNEEPFDKEKAEQRERGKKNLKPRKSLEGVKLAVDKLKNKLKNNSAEYLYGYLVRHYSVDDDLVKALLDSDAYYGEKEIEKYFYETSIGEKTFYIGMIPDKRTPDHPISATLIQIEENDKEVVTTKKLTFGGFKEYCYPRKKK